MKFKSTLHSSKLLNILFFLLPVAYILGNFAVNVFTVLTILIGIFFYKTEIIFFTLKNKKFFSLLIIFFFLLIISTGLKYAGLDHDSVAKSFLYLRYLFFTIIVCLIVKNNNLDFRYFLFSCLFCSLFLSVDVIFQSINGKDFFGFKSLMYWNPGFFDKELIAGSYIQRFFLLGIFLIPLLFNRNKKTFFIFVLILLIGFSATTLSGNRMPIVLFITFIVISLIFLKKLRYNFLITIFLIPIVYAGVISSNKSISHQHHSFWENINDMYPSILNELKREYPELDKNVVFRHAYKRGNLESQKKNNKQYVMQSFGSGHVTIFVTAIDTWLDSPLIGSGIKSFRVNCKNKLHLPNRVCESHPHNYYLGILNSTGIIGIILVISILFLIFKNFIKLNLLNNNKLFLVYNAVTISLLVELFPVRSSGDFFSTQSSTFIFLLIGMSWGLIIKNNSNKLKAN